MRGWTFLLGGLIVWAVHFFALYGIASVFLTTMLARILAILMSLACLVADGLLLARALRVRPVDAAEIWQQRIALIGAALSAVAILWQALPALLV